MMAREPKVIEILQHRGGGWDVKEMGKPVPLVHFDREVDAERKARELAKQYAETQIVVRGESGRIYQRYTVTRESLKQEGRTKKR